MQNKKDFSGIFWFHLTLLLISYSSFLWLHWKVIFLLGIILRIYRYLRGGCDITFLEFGRVSEKHQTFTGYYLKKIFPNYNQKRLNFFFDYIVPILILIFAYLRTEVILK